MTTSWPESQPRPLTATRLIIARGAFGMPPPLPSPPTPRPSIIPRSYAPLRAVALRAWPGPIGPSAPLRGHQLTLAERKVLISPSRANGQVPPWRGVIDAAPAVKFQPQIYRCFFEQCWCPGVCSEPACPACLHVPLASHIPDAWPRPRGRDPRPGEAGWADVK